MTEREWDPEELAEFADAKPADACRCGGDMPGRCPGPSNCPMRQPEKDADDDA